MVGSLRSSEERDWARARCSSVSGLRSGWDEKNLEGREKGREREWVVGKEGLDRGR